MLYMVHACFRHGVYTYGKIPKRFKSFYRQLRLSPRSLLMFVVNFPGFEVPKVVATNSQLFDYITVQPQVKFWYSIVTSMRLN